MLKTDIHGVTRAERIRQALTIVVQAQGKDFSSEAAAYHDHHKLRLSQTGLSLYLAPSLAVTLSYLNLESLFYHLGRRVGKTHVKTCEN